MSVDALKHKSGHAQANQNAVVADSAAQLFPAVSNALGYKLGHAFAGERLGLGLKAETKYESQQEDWLPLPCAASSTRTCTVLLPQQRWPISHLRNDFLHHSRPSYRAGFHEVWTNTST